MIGPAKSLKDIDLGAILAGAVDSADAWREQPKSRPPAGLARQSASDFKLAELLLKFSDTANGAGGIIKWIIIGITIGDFSSADDEVALPIQERIFAQPPAVRAVLIAAPIVLQVVNFTLRILQTPAANSRQTIVLMGVKVQCAL